MKGWIWLSLGQAWCPRPWSDITDCVEPVGEFFVLPACVTISLFDLRFADDILLFAKTFEETKFLLDELVTCLAEVGLHLNVGKTKILTTQSQCPSEVPLRNGQVIEVPDRGSTHKWLGCMPCTASTGNHAPDLAHHLQAASQAFFAHRFFFRQQECYYARPCQIFWRHGHSCCLFRCCAQKGVQTRPVQDGYCVSPVTTFFFTTFHCWATWWRGLDVAVAWNPSPLEWTS